MRKVLVITPFNAQWVGELHYSFEGVAEASYLSLDFPPITQEMIDQNSFDYFAQIAYDRLLLELAKTEAHEIYISYEFAWKYFESDCFKDLGANIRIVGMLWDDSTFHELNYRLAQHIGVDTFTTGCPISVLRLQEKGCFATFMQAYGARKTYTNKKLSEKPYVAAFFGDPNKADRKSMLLPFEAVPDFEVFGGRWHPLSLEEMIERIRNTKIIINFSKSFIDERNRTVYQYKARILESIFCGSLPLTEYCPATEILLDGVVPQFREPEEGVSKLSYYRDNEKITNKTIRLLSKISTKYRPDESLKKIFGDSGI